MTKTKRLVGDNGIKFNNMFVTSPLCCPSRSSIFTGKYIHNHNALNNSVAGNCSSPAWQAGPEKEAFITKIKSQGYNTFFSGKYLNQYGFPQTGGVQHVPPGWDWWVGLVGNSRYYNYALSVNGTMEKHGKDYEKDYLTDVIHRRGIEFLNYQTENDPFFMMLSTPACHAPFTPAPQYAKNFSDLKAPRNGSYNVHGTDKHWLIRAAKSPMSQESVDMADDAFRNRWRTLLSVDDMVEDVVNTLQQKGLLDNTYIFFTGDNGFHLGQFSLPIDKRQLYEFDIRVPLMVRGPGIAAGQVREEIMLNIDFAPTFVELAGLSPPVDMDGMSMAKVLMDKSNKSLSFRDTFLVEHVGEYTINIPGCPNLYNQDVMICSSDCVCEDSRNNSFGCLRSINSKSSMKYCEMADDQACQDYCPALCDSKNNTFSCVRVKEDGIDVKYCEIPDDNHFIEHYDVTEDPFELTNLYPAVGEAKLAKYKDLLYSMARCAGENCKQTLQPKSIQKLHE
ncbi:N-acetylglucosamine-6-sulfatase-like [Liolophura sinensis]|uniref:N-acetylglucosamine-6-sulfatase-like n=1 Tax=Liolophura sinensis TaxID=3198878 RepID=UPI0031588581